MKTLQYTKLGIGNVFMHCLFILVFFTCSVHSQQASSGQTLEANTPGSPSGTYPLSGFESVNLFNGNLSFNLPLHTLAGRGELQHPIFLPIEQQWVMAPAYNDSNTGNFVTRPGPANNEGFVDVYTFGQNPAKYDGPSLYKPGAMEIRYGGTGAVCGANNSLPYFEATLTRLYYIAPDGTEYEFRDQISNGETQDLNWNTLGGNCYPQNSPFSRGTIFTASNGVSATFISDSNITDNYNSRAFQKNYSTAGASGNLKFSDGSVFRFDNGIIKWKKDRNGNLINLNQAVVNGQAINTLTDSLNRATTVKYGTTTNALEDEITFDGFQGTDRDIIVRKNRLSQLLRQTQTGDSSTTKMCSEMFHDCIYDANEHYNPYKVSEVELPDGRKYIFNYNVFGELARVVLPTGGAIEYDWSGYNWDQKTFPGVMTSGWGSYDIIHRRVIERRVYTTGNNSSLQNTMKYAATYTARTGNTGINDTKVQEDVFDASGNRISRTNHYYKGSPVDHIQSYINGHMSFYSHWLQGKEYQTDSLDSNGTTILRSVEYKWEQPTAGNNWPLTQSESQVTVRPNNPQITEITTTLVDLNKKSMQRFAYDSYYNKTDIFEYDYGDNAVGSFLRRSHYDYKSDTNYTSQSGPHLRSLISQAWISSDVNGNNKVSLTEYEYDNYTSEGGTNPKHAGLVARNSISGHGSTLVTNPTHADTYLTRGNVTAVKSYTNAQAPSGEVAVYSQYDIAGNVVKTFDAKGKATVIDYSDNFGSPSGEARTNTAPTQLNGQSTFAFPKSATNALGWVTGYSQYDYYTGKPVDIENLNGVVSSVYYNDPLDRPTQTITANNLTAYKQQTTIAYNDAIATRKVTVTSDLFNYGDNLSKSESFYDGLGRTVETRRYESGGTYVATQSIPFVMVQDPETSIWRAAAQVSNPYRQNDTIFWTKTLSDSLGRTIKVISPPDGATNGAMVKTEYSGNLVTVTDPAGKKRRSETNALGFLSRVDEPNNAGQLDVSSVPAQPTNYTYDPLGNLTAVQQIGNNEEECGAGVFSCTQNRTFQYDSLSRLKEATNPEMGTTPTNGKIYYLYDNNGNLTKKTDPRGVETNYSYDDLNRVTNRTYSDPGGLMNYEAAQPVTYTYENTSVTSLKGVLTKVTNVFSTTEYQAFDALGRVTQSQQSTDGMTIDPMTYKYNLSGALVEQKYPSGRVVKNVLENDGDLSMVQSKKNANAGFWTYANSFTYTAAGAISSMQLGNGKWESTQFNSRLQPTQIALGTVQNGTDKLNLEFAYNTITGGTPNADNNGNVLSQKITVLTDVIAGQSHNGFTATQNYTYDSLNRLKSAEETIPSQTGWKQTFKYDRYGNRTFDEANTTTLPKNCGTNPNYTVCASDNPSANASNNRLSGFTFDKAGNTTKDPKSKKFTYDGENKQTKVETVDQNNNVTATHGIYSYDGDGKRVKKIRYENNQIEEITVFVYDASGKMVAEYSTVVATTLAKVSYLTSDHLGSPRINTDADGKTISRHDYQPFGEEISRMGYGSDDVRKKFTGYERDGESGLDFAQARYFNSGFGRFSSPDPLFYTSSRPGDPQQFNLYVYVRNSPLKFIDPSGYDAKATSNGAALTEDDRLELEKELKRIAPGTRVNVDGSIKKAGFWKRVANRLTGHGVGQELVSGLVNSNRTTTINVLRSGESGADTTNQNAALDATNGTGTDATVDWNINQQSGGAMERTARDAYTGNGEVTEDLSPDRATVLGHELIHALHIVSGTASFDSSASHDFVASASGVSDVFREANPNAPTREEFRTVGFYPFAGRREVTENRLRRELKQPLRVAYLPIKDWTCVSCGP